MLDVKFEIGGRFMDPLYFGDSAERETLIFMMREINRKLGDISDPVTGRPPRVWVVGEDFASLRYEVQGSPEVVRRIREQLGDVATESITVSSNH